MLLADAEKLARELMAQFGLAPAWRFEFDDAKRRFGCCHRGYLDQKITLSRELTLRNDREQVEDTIRHEIAHAKCPPKSGHGAEWKAMCKVTGANPKRCYDHEEVDAPQGDWRATCHGCGVVHHKFRRPKRDLWCARKECVAKNGRMTPEQKLVWRHKDALPEPKPCRAAIDAMKAVLRAQEPAYRAASDAKPSSESGMLQCVKCDARSLGSKVCPGCGGELKPERVLQAEKEVLKRRIAELERKAGK